MQFIATSFVLLSTALSALTAAVPGAHTTLKEVITEGSANAPADYAALSAKLGLDLSKIPATQAVPELGLTPIITGEGLPTVEELKLTWADLTKEIPVLTEEGVAGRSLYSGASELRRRYDPWCDGNRQINADQARSCYNYLRGLGSTNCGVSGGGGRTGMCQSGNTVWWGYSVNSSPQSSACRDVAEGGAWVLNSCWFGNGLHEGSNAAWGNGNLVVNLSNI